MIFWASYSENATGTEVVNIYLDTLICKILAETFKNILNTSSSLLVELELCSNPSNLPTHISLFKRSVKKPP